MLPQLESAGETSIGSPATFFSALGNLHDAKISHIQWIPSRQEVIVVVDDLYSNFAGLPEYPGQQPMQMSLQGVSHLEVDAKSDKFPMRIDNLLIKTPGPNPMTLVLFQFGPSGFMTVSCRTISCRTISK